MIGGVPVPASSQSRTIDVGQGIFALRYVGSAARAGAPRIVVEPFAEPGLSLIAAPGRAERILSAPGDCVLIRAERPARVTLTASGPGGLDADLRLERVTAVELPAPLRAVVPEALPAAAPRIEILAHLARRGDVTFGLDAWIGGPAFPSRIEGLTIRWDDRPADVDLTCTVVSRGRRPRRFAEVGTGRFAGTRGEAAPIVGLELALTGPGAGRYGLSGEALFFGQPLAACAGPRLRFSGPSGREPLVGLRFTLAAARPHAVPDLRPTSAPLARPVPGRVRMFRGASMPAA